MYSKEDEGRNLEEIAKLLEESSDYKVLRRISAPRVAENMEDSTRCALIVDTETTGLDLDNDEVIEIGFVLIEYNDKKIVSIQDFGNEIREPKRPISKVVQSITGITPAMVRGKEINEERVLSAVSRANIVIAHNAEFDRPMCERLFSDFKSKPWACTLKEVRWDNYGYESGKLKYLLLESGYFFEGHRALDDCMAVKQLLSLLSPSGESFFEHLMESARGQSFEFITNSPYELREVFRSNRYKWSASAGRTKGQWVKTVNADRKASEISFLENLSTKGVSFEVKEKDAFTRYKRD